MSILIISIQDEMYERQKLWSFVFMDTSWDISEYVSVHLINSTRAN